MVLPPPFAFLKPGELIDGDLQLKLKETVHPMLGRAPAYRFDMRRLPDGSRIGRIELRIGMTNDLVMYTGHIGYRVDPAFRGQRYAARGCLLLAGFARQHGHREIWITCDPDNAASFRTCELTGAEFLGVVPVPKHHLFYKAGSKEKCRFRLTLE